VAHVEWAIPGWQEAKIHAKFPNVPGNSLSVPENLPKCQAIPATRD
jgi:hypothetical protein